ncbi:MAG: hypothetical protein GY796_22155 [Chloroflexi bacterium]|nr:hypothetical protein [Chloroflexota bacterium]
MFEINGVYANRKGEYTVLKMTPPLMRVRYISDGSEANLKISVQERIWGNISVEYEAKTASKSTRRKPVLGTNYCIKAVSIPTTDDLNYIGWAARLLLAPQNSEIKLKAGDRIIVYVLESKTFIAVTTITGESKTAKPKDYPFTISQKKAEFFPIDVDGMVMKLENGVEVDSVELESQPRFKRLRPKAESYLAISEDDFELLTEALTEMIEEEDDDADDLDDEEDNEDNEDNE